MDIAEIKSAVDQIGSAFAEFKRTNDERLDAIAKKGSAPAGLEEKLAKLDAEMVRLGEVKSRLETVEAAFKRGGAQTDSERTAAGSLEQKKAMNAYLRSGDTKGLDSLVEKKLMSVGIDPDGGYLVTPDTSGRIVTRIIETSPMRLAGAAVQVISTDALEGLIDIDEADGEWTAETGLTTNQKTPQLGKYRIPVHELSTRPKATQKLLEDAAFDPEAWLARKVADKFMRMENTAFVTGDGIARPRGILSYAAGTTHGKVQQVVTGNATAITSDGIVDLIYSLKEGYRANAKFAMARLTVAAIRKLKDLNGMYMWQPSLQIGQPATLMGYGIVEFSDMPVVAASSLSVAFADFGTAYQIVDRTGVSVLVDPYTAKPLVEYFTRRRVGGDVLNFDAIKLLRTSV